MRTLYINEHSIHISNHKQYPTIQCAHSSQKSVLNCMLYIQTNCTTCILNIIELSSMNYCYNYPNVTTFYTQPEDAANYFNSLAQVENYYADPSNALYYQTLTYSYPYYTPYSYCKPNSEAERSTSDSDDQPSREQERPEIKDENSIFQQNPILQTRSFEEEKPKNTPAKSSNFKKAKKIAKCKKNTESNLANNIISYICNPVKSHKTASYLLKTGQRVKIFYIFMKNLKRLNSKYVSRKNVESLITLKPNDPHQRVLSKSVKRLEILPIQELRSVLRKMVYEYLRNSASLVPVLTSKKISRLAIKQHMDKRRELLLYFFPPHPQLQQQ